MPVHGLFYQLHFYLFGIFAIASALFFVTRKSPVAAALWLVNVMFSLAAMYIMMDAQFIGAIQVMVYAGAIMVVFLFVVMLLNLGHAQEFADIRGKWGRLIAGLFGLALLAELYAIGKQPVPTATVEPAPVATDRVIDAVAHPLFTEYLLAFEVTSVLLLAAIVGAVILAKRRV